MKTKLFWLATVLLVVWTLKRYYSTAGADDLRWILGPTARLAGAVTGASFAPEMGAGYLSRERLFLIEKSCAGLNFLIAAFGMSAFVLRRRIASWISGTAVVAGSLLAAYCAAVTVNAVRIVIAMWLAAHPLAWARLDPAQIHRLEGICVYFAGLMLLYELVLAVERRALPLGSRV